MKVKIYDENGKDSNDDGCSPPPGLDDQIDVDNNDDDDGKDKGDDGCLAPPGLWG